MGDRANVVLEQGNGKIFLYTHWGGSELPEDLRIALARKQRWDDEAYLARIIFCQMVRDAMDDETGFGISIHEQDSNHPHLIVNSDQKIVKVGDKSYTFDQYIAMGSLDGDPITWEQLTGG